MIKCPCCDGDGEFVIDVVEFTEITYACGLCNGKAEVSIWQWIYWWWIGGFGAEVRGE